MHSIIILLVNEAYISVAKIMIKRKVSFIIRGLAPFLSIMPLKRFILCNTIHVQEIIDYSKERKLNNFLFRLFVKMKALVDTDLN